MSSNPKQPHTRPAGDSITNPLMPISKTVIKADRPLPCPIYRQDGELLAAKDTVLTEDQAVALVTSGVLFTPKSELVKFTLDGPGRGTTTQAYRAKTPFALLLQLESDLTEIFSDYTLPTGSAKLNSAAGRIQTICNQWPEAALAKIFFDDKSRYAVQHSIHVAILSELVAQHLKWPDAARRPLVGAALSMNIALGFLQDDWQLQKESLSEEQRDILQQHPAESAEILTRMGITDDDWLTYVRTHHEKTDGSGYPIGLMRDDLPLGSQIIQVADMYSAKVSGRRYRDAFDATEAARYFYTIKEETQLKELVDAFVKTIGLYPPGTLVELMSGEIAIVIRRGNQIHKPVVKCIADRYGQRLGTPIVRNTQDSTYSIKNFTHLPYNFGALDYEALWGFSG